MGKKKSVTVGLVTFVIVLMITTAMAVIYLTSESKSRREKAAFISESISDRIEAEIQSREYITRMLEIQIDSDNGDFTQAEFKKVGEALFDDYLDVIDITVAPNGVISYIYPMENGAAERINLFEDSSERIYVDSSKKSGVSYILAPVVLKDGSYGIIIRRPIYHGSDKSETNFWGFASITLNLSAFLNEVNIKGLAEEGYQYKLLSNDIITGDNRIIMEYSENELPTPVDHMINTVGGSYWKLYIAPMDNWMDPREILAAIAIALVISILAGFGASSYMSMKANAKELEILSYRDSLTNLYNPRSYQEHMDELTKKKLPFGIVFMDLNDFKQVNDTYGHEAGDALLNIVAKRLKNSIREKDRAFRIGGDEFVVVIHGTHDTGFYDGVITRMRTNVAREVTIGEVTLQVSISAGFARYPEDGTKLEDVVKKADDAMYHNKRLMKARRGQSQERGKVTARDFH